jgi:hypothetical protein
MNPSQGRAITVHEAEVQPDPVDGVRLANDIRAAISQYIYMPQHAVDAVTLWTLWTHVYHHFCFSPRLVIVSSVAVCGKTKLLTILAHLTPRAILAGSSISLSGMYQAINAECPTLLIDNAEYVKRNKKVCLMIRQGYDKFFAHVDRVVGGKWQIFSTFCPVALAMNGSVPELIKDRSIVIVMQREPVQDRLARTLREGTDLRTALAPLMDQCERWAQAREQEISRHDNPSMPDQLDHRNANIWYQLLAVADALGGPWPEQARTAAVALCTRTMPGNKPAFLH